MVIELNYFQWLTLFLGLPLFFLYTIRHDIFVTNQKIFLKTTIGALLFTFLWDLLSIKTGIWYYPKPLSGIDILGLPIEEFLFLALSANLLTYITLILFKKYGR